MTGRALWRCSLIAVMLRMYGCSRGSNDDRLLGTWTNHHTVARQPALESVTFLSKNTVTIDVTDALAAAGWHRQTTSTGTYEVIAPSKLKITETLGSAVLDYQVDNTRLILSGHGLAGLLGRDEPPQVLDKASR
jgi:hypothetical protein